MMVTITASAQTTITFDTDDYKAIGVYDNAENSPLRKGLIKGNAAVVDNPNTEVDPVLGEAPNPSDKVLALQRSRFGSNTYGVRVDLKEPFRVTKTNQYVHVMALFNNKPVSSKVMVIGLGKRTEKAWSWQDGTDEQFWAQTTTSVDPSDSWQDLVCSFKGFSYTKEENDTSGIDIYSLIIVPDLRSPHADTEDWIAYVDQIQVDASAAKRFSTQKYARNFDDTQTCTHSTGRTVTGVGLTIGDVTQSATNSGTLCYNNRTMTTVFSAKPGDTVRPVITYPGTWMSGYAYVDWNVNGIFDDDEMVSTTGTGNTIGNAMPTFTIPTGTTPGFYRMRYKVDWDCTDPAGNAASDNLIYANGGGIVDIMLDIHEADISVTANQLNGDIFAKDGSALQNYKATYGKDLQIKPDPAPGFIYNGMTLKHGYNINESQMDNNGNPNWFSVTFDRDDSRYVTIPAANIIGGQVYIEGIFKDMDNNEQLADLIEKATAAYNKTVKGEAMITNSSQLYSPYSETSEGAIVNLIDGDLTTFWHSKYSGGSVASGLHYLSLFYTAKDSIKAGQYTLTIGRRDNTSTTIANDHLTKAKIVGTDTKSAAASTCTEIATISLPFVSQKEYVSAVFDMPKSFKYIRIVELETNGEQRGYWHAGEVQLYRMNYMRDSIPEAAEQLKTALDKAKTVTDATDDDVAALKTAYQDYLAAYELYEANKVLASVKASTKTTLENLANITALYTAEALATAEEDIDAASSQSAIDDACDTFYKAAEGRMFTANGKVRTSGTAKYITQSTTTSVITSTTLSANAVYYATYVGDGSYKVYSRYNNGYWGKLTGRNTAMVGTADATSAGTYKFEWNTTANSYGDQVNIKNNEATTGYYYFHDSTNDGGCVVDWTAAADASKWQLTSVTEDEYQKLVTPTGIYEVKNSSNSSTGSKCYNAAGQRIDAANAHGLIITEGKKSIK